LLRQAGRAVDAGDRERDVVVTTGRIGEGRILFGGRRDTVAQRKLATGPVDVLVNCTASGLLKSTTNVNAACTGSVVAVGVMVAVGEATATD
jgi:hypothetical protein